MQLTWLGRYRGVVAALVHHSNSVNRVLTSRMDMGGGIMLSSQELQILEALIEHEDENYIMSDIAAGLAIPQSSMTKISQQLAACGLIERYRREGNRKNVILKPSEKGRALYDDYCENYARDLFAPLFDGLAPLTDEQLAIVADAIFALDGVISQSGEEKLVKIDDME